MHHCLASRQLVYCQSQLVNLSANCLASPSLPSQIGTVIFYSNVAPILIYKWWGWHIGLRLPLKQFVGCYSIRLLECWWYIQMIKCWRISIKLRLWHKLGWLLHPDKLRLLPPILLRILLLNNTYLEIAVILPIFYISSKLIIEQLNTKRDFIHTAIKPKLHPNPLEQVYYIEHKVVVFSIYTITNIAGMVTAL